MELIDLVNSVIIFVFQTTLLKWLTFLIRSLLDFFLSCDPSICSTVAFLPLGNSDHIDGSVSIDFPSNLERDAPFHFTTYGCCRAAWDGLGYHLRDVSREGIFKLGSSASNTEFCEWIPVGTGQL